MGPGSIIEQTVETAGGELDVPAGVADFAMPEVRLNEAQVGAALGEIVAARVPERVGVNVQMFKAGALGCAVEHELHGARAKRGAALGGEDVVTRRVAVLAPHPPQGADLNPAESVVAVQAVLQSAEMQHALVEVEVIPAEPERLAEPQAMRKKHEEKSSVAEPPAPLASRFNELLDFFGSEVLTFARPAARAGLADSSLYANWEGFGHSQKVSFFKVMIPRLFAESTFYE